MSLFRATRGGERHLLDSSFGPDGDGYVFYRHHLARGIPVTAAERESYLRPPLGGSRRDFYQAIRGAGRRFCRGAAGGARSGQPWRRSRPSSASD